MTNTATATAKIANLFAQLSTAKLIESWELTDTNNDPNISTVRGWLMDEMESRNPEAFNIWMEADPHATARSFFL
jgi:hypothetical protein